MNIHCPSCDASFTVTVKPIDGRGRVFAPDSPITPKTLKAVLEFMREIGPGKNTVAELELAYEIRRNSHPAWPAISKQALVRSLQSNGATRWRTASSRGYEIPEIPEEQQPAPPAPSVRAQTRREAERQILDDHQEETVMYPWSDGTTRREPEPGRQYDKAKVKGLGELQRDTLDLDHLFRT